MSNERARGAAGEGGPRVGFVSLGCPKNLVDSEVMLGYLSRSGASIVSDPLDAEIIVVNTCGFIDAARAESVETILEAAELKRTGRARKLVVAGCLVQRSREALGELIPEIDAFIGLDEIPNIVALVSRESTPAPSRRSCPAPEASATPATWIYDHASPRLRVGPVHTAYVKISEGCDNPCTFCSIPTFRGRYRSRALESVVDEASRLVSEGVREINLIAQDSTHYGADLGLADGPARLLRALDEVEGIGWIRLFYAYPNRVTGSLLAAMGSCDRVVKYLDIPLQSASRSVLARMRRGGSGEEQARLIEKIRREVPGIALRTTFIVGFPGETDEEFRETLDLIRDVGFDHAGAFQYSHEEGTPAAAGEDDVPEDVKAERYRAILDLQERIALGKNRSRIGSTIEVLCEGAHPESDDLLVGRHAGQAPEIDGSVILNEGSAEPGTFVRAEVVEAHPFDLVARVVAAVAGSARP